VGITAFVLTPFAFIGVGVWLTRNLPWWWQVIGALLVLVYVRIVDRRSDEMLTRLEKEAEKERR
jgi:drug/metabolite transporter (DMT)-like permease